MTRLLLFALTAFALLVSHAVMGAESRDLEKVVKPFFAQHCNSCHGAKTQKGDLRVDTLAVDLRLLADTDKFAAAFTEKLATYALRRGMTFSDREELQPIVAAAKKTDYQLLSVIESLVTSPLFLKR